ncbi:MAG TPA: hypothetical protein VFV67_10555 [Actinophytocola sp.]|uniref:hypothetical protein n=1 Tax=Actinophytocola sp. TaxID=1872138 RepID=UPI002DBF7793|nr:hypothetical protein [Actinophytocola sp.]HEU5471084.1 hypothetical protein [Actinophytocola sp.]
MVDNVWAWEGGNPYLSTALQVVDVDPMADQSAVRTRANVRRRRIAHAADRFPLFGRTLTVAEINEAEERLGTPRGRLLAELLTHRPVTGDADPGELADLLDLLDTTGFFELAAGLGAQTAPRAVTDLHDTLDPRVLPAILPDPGARTFAPLLDDAAEPVR